MTVSSCRCICVRFSPVFLCARSIVLDDKSAQYKKLLYCARLYGEAKLDKITLRECKPVRKRHHDHFINSFSSILFNGASVLR